MKQKTILEKNFQRKVQKDLKLMPDCWFYKAADRSRSGIPDIIACINGTFVALELKRSEKEKATPLQLYTLDEINNAGGYQAVACPENWAEILEALRQL